MSNATRVGFDEDGFVHISYGEFLVQKNYIVR